MGVFYEIKTECAELAKRTEIVVSRAACPVCHWVDGRSRDRLKTRHRTFGLAVQPGRTYG